MHEKRFDAAKLAKLNDPARLTEMEVERMAAALALTPGGVLVDVGAGTGIFTFELARLTGASRVIALDVEPVMLAWLAGHIPADLRQVIEPLAGAAETMPLADGCADALVAVNLHHELDDPEAMLAEAFRVLKPGGRLLVVDWKAAETPKGPPLAQRIPSETVAGAMRDAGFTVGAIDEAPASHHFVLGTRP